MTGICTSSFHCKSAAKSFHSWSGVVRGAVLAGIGMGIPIPPKVSRCLRHYGVCVAEEYKHWQHFEQDQVSDVFHGRPMARDPLIWKVRKGDLILPNEPIIKVFAINCKFTDPAHQPVDQTVNIKFVATALDDLPLKLSQLPRGIICPQSVTKFRYQRLIRRRFQSGRGHWDSFACLRCQQSHILSAGQCW